MKRGHAFIYKLENDVLQASTVFFSTTFYNELSRDNDG